MRNAVAIGVSFFLFCGIVLGLHSTGTTTAALPGGHSPGEIRFLPFDPFQYFSRNCARCHGPGGSFYGDDFGRKHSAGELHEIVEEMAAGPGGFPLRGDSLEALVAYHRSLSQNSPFILITALHSDTLKGVVTPGAAVRLIGPDTSYTVEVSGYQWRATLQKGWAREGSLRIQACTVEDTTTLRPGQTAHSHSSH